MSQAVSFAEIRQLDGLSLAERYRTGELKPSQVTKLYLEAAAEHCYDNQNDRPRGLNIYLSLRQTALSEALAADWRYAAGQPLSPLDGVPIALKDNLMIEGEVVTAASRYLAKHVAGYSATVVKKLQQAGLIILGKTNLDEFAMGGSTENSAFGVTANPLDPSRVAGGSSGGAAAVVAARLAPLALGSDTGGSIRQPAAFCGVIGFKPSYGRVSRYGLIAMASSLDQIGPLARSVTDIRALMKIIESVGQESDRLDQTTRADWAPLASQSSLSSTEFEPQADPARLRVATIDLESSGQGDSRLNQVLARWPKTAIDQFELAINLYYLICPVEVASNLARFDGIRYDRQSLAQSSTALQPSGLLARYLQSRSQLLGPEVKRRILLGTYTSSAGYAEAYYQRALVGRRQLKQAFENAWQSVDILACPTAPGEAFEIGSLARPIDLYRQDLYTVAANLAGLPAIALPCGEGPAGMPLSLQLMAASGNDDQLLTFAEQWLKEQYEQK